MRKIEANISLSDQRICFQNEFFRSYATVFIGETDSVFQKFLDNTLAGNRTINISAETDVCVLFIPLVGAIEVNDEIVNSGEILYRFLGKEEALTLKNPYQKDLVNYLEIWLKTNQKPTVESELKIFDIGRNWLVDISVNGLGNKICIGKYDGREEDYLEIKTHQKGFVFIINGAFEVANRLLENRDALLIGGIEKVEFEALSEEAIILIIS